jgi:hypothetical protein
MQLKAVLGGYVKSMISDWRIGADPPYRGIPGLVARRAKDAPQS